MCKTCRVTGMGCNMINAERALAQLKNREKDIAIYNEIISTFQQTNVKENEKFRKTYTYFYKLRRKQEWRDFYFAYFEQHKNEKDITFEQIIRAIYEQCGWVEASFASKMLATINSNQPILDSVVLGKLGMKITGNTSDKKMESALECYRKLEYWYKGFIVTAESKKYIELFDKQFPQYKRISQIKKLDFILWADGSAMLKCMEIKK